MAALALGRRPHDRREQRRVEERHADAQRDGGQPDRGHRPPDGHQAHADADATQRDGGTPAPAQAVGQAGAHDPDDQDEPGVQAEHGAHALLTQVLGEQRNERREGDERDQPEEQDHARQQGVPLQEVAVRRHRRRGPPGNPQADDRGTETTGRQGGPQRGEAVGDQRLADRRPDRQAPVERDREVRRRLAPAMVGRQVLGRRRHAHEHRRLAGTGEQPGEHEHPQLGGGAVEQDRDAHHRGPGHRQHAAPPGVADAAGPGTQQRRRHRQRADADAHLDPAAAQFVLDEPRHRGDERPQGHEVREGRQHHHRELRREQALLVVV